MQAREKPRRRYAASVTTLYTYPVRPDGFAGPPSRTSIAPTAHAASPTPPGASTTYAAIVGSGSPSRARSIASASCCHGPGSTGCPAIAPSITARSLTSSAASPATARRALDHEPQASRTGAAPCRSDARRIRSRTGSGGSRGCSRSRAWRGTRR